MPDDSIITKLPTEIVVTRRHRKDRDKVDEALTIITNPLRLLIFLDRCGEESGRLLDNPARSLSAASRTDLAKQLGTGRQEPQGAVPSGRLRDDGEEIRWYEGPPSLAVTEHWNYEDEGKDFFGGYSYMSQGPLPNVWASAQTRHGLWGDALSDEMQKYNHQAGLKMVGECCHKNVIA